MTDQAQSQLVASGVIAVVSPCLFWLYRFNRRRVNALIEQWAADNQLRIVEQKFEPFRRGPFLLTIHDGDQIFRIIAVDAKGYGMGGWLRCSSRMSGRYAGRVEVHRDGRAPAE